MAAWKRFELRDGKPLFVDYENVCCAIKKRIAAAHGRLSITAGTQDRLLSLQPLQLQFSDGIPPA